MKTTNTNRIAKALTAPAKRKTASEKVGKLYLAPEFLAKIKEACRNAAIKAHENLPQYKGTFDGPEWMLARFLTRIQTKSGEAFFSGEYALVKVGGVISAGPYKGTLSFVAYSEANKIQTAVRPEDFRFVEGIESWE